MGMKAHTLRIQDRVRTCGGGETGTVIGLGFTSTDIPMVQVKFDREGLNYGCEGPQAGQWVEEIYLTTI